MGAFGIGHWIVLAIVAILLLGGGRFSNMMGDVAKGIKQFKKGMSDEEAAAQEPSRIDAKKAAEPAFDVEGEKVAEKR